MSTIASANLVGITGIARRLVLDGALDEAGAREAMAAATHVWDVPKLKAWLTNPETVVPGQDMNYRLDIPQDRDDVVAYLASVSVPASPSDPSSNPRK